VATYTGLLEMALTGGHVVKPNNGWYQRVNTETGELVEPKVREKDTLKDEFWEPMWKDTDFATFLNSQYSMTKKSLVSMDDIVDGDEIE